MDNLLNEAIGLAGVMSPVILIFVQLIKTADLDKRWLPFLSIGLGVAVGIVFALASNADMFLYGLAGFMSGATASGLYDGIKAVKRSE